MSLATQRTRDPVLALDRLCRTHKLILGVDWRPIDPPVLGQVNALPNSRGFAIATNGIDVLIAQGINAHGLGSFFRGHFAWFEAENAEEETLILAGHRKEPKTRRKRITIDYE